MRGSATIAVWCDRCKGQDEIIELTATARGWDERNVANELKKMDWRVEGGEDICPECVEEEAQAQEEPV